MNCFTPAELAELFEAPPDRIAMYVSAPASIGDALEALGGPGSATLFRNHAAVVMQAYPHDRYPAAVELRSWLTWLYRDLAGDFNATAEAVTYLCGLELRGVELTRFETRALLDELSKIRARLSENQGQVVGT